MFDPDLDPRNIAEVQRIFRSYFGDAYADYADRIPDLLRRQAKRKFRTVLLTAQDHRRRVLAFALAFHYGELESTLLDFIVVDPAVRQRGIGGALYEALREYLGRLGSRGLYLEARPDDKLLEPDQARRRENRARIRFYEAYGARVIAGTEYEAKREGRTEGEPYVMFDALGEERRPTAEEVRGMFSVLLFEKYKYAANDSYALGIVESVVEDPVALQPPRTSTAPAKVPTTHGIFSPIKVLVPARHELHHVRERGYVERPVRVRSIVAALEKLQGVEIMPVREHGEEPILEVHDHDFVKYLKTICSRLKVGETVYPYVFPIRFPDRKPVDEEVQAGYYCIDTFTPLSHNAYIAARDAVDCALTGVDLLLEGEQLAYAICRPPGHHAERRVYGGFCYFNSAAVAANRLSKEGRVAMLDIDFHHGNGTQDIFYERGDVLTLSIHGDPSYAYPYFAGFADEEGEGAGEGFNVNHPLPENIDDEAYLEVLEKVIQRIEAFDPRYLVVSVGLDIAKGDPTGAWLVTPDGFSRIGAALAGLQLPTLAVQEGGYDTRTIGRNARHFIGGLQRGVYERRDERRPATEKTEPPTREK